jgi:hypothetical protein
MKITATPRERRRGVSAGFTSSGRNVARQLAPSYEWTLVKRQQIVVPISVGVRNNLPLALDSSGISPDDQIQPDQPKGACRVIPQFATFNIEAKYLLDS